MRALTARLLWLGLISILVLLAGNGAAQTTTTVAQPTWIPGCGTKPDGCFPSRLCH